MSLLNFRRAMALGLFLLLLSISSVRADDCSTLPPPSVSVTRLDEPVTVNLEYSYRSLTNIADFGLPPGRQVLGLTRGTAIASFKTSANLRVDASGRWECASPEISLTYGFRPLTVYVGREFVPGSCAYEQIYQHEQKHVQIYQQHMRDVEGQILDALKDRFVTGKPWRGPVGQTRDQLQNELEQRWMPYFKLLLQRVESLQAKIDTPQEYARVADSCAGEIRKILRRP